jgi:polyhydroxyalkanoate synthesis repressor PhaR
MGTIRRYDSRKLYDPGTRRYVSLEEIADRIRDGEEIEVLESSTGDDVTGQTLAQILLEEGRSGRGRLPAEVLHDLVRVSGRRATSGASHAQRTMNRLMRASLERLAPVREARRDVARLEERLRQLEKTLASLDQRPAAPARPRGKTTPPSRRRPPARPGRGAGAAKS